MPVPDGPGHEAAGPAGVVGDNPADGGDVLPCGDAIADPLTGVHAAVATAAALRGDRAVLLDVSTRDVVAATRYRPCPIPPFGHRRCRQRVVGVAVRGTGGGVAACGR